MVHVCTTDEVRAIPISIEVFFSVQALESYKFFGIIQFIH